MVELRFSLVLDLGVGHAARARPGVRQRNSARRMEERRRATAVRPLSSLPPDELGLGPLEPEALGRGYGEAERSHEAYDNERRDD